MLVSVQQPDGDAKSITAELTRITGQPVVFAPFTPNDAVGIDVKRAPLWDVLEALSASGKIEIGRDEFTKLRQIRKALVTGERMAVCLHNTTVQRAVRELSSLSGLRIRVTSGDPKVVVSLTETDVNLEEILAKLAIEGGVEIAIK